MTSNNGARKDVMTWASKARQATAKRDAAIHKMREEGATLRDIGDAAGLSHTAVAKILLHHPPTAA
jgi:hypothetical protein